MAKKSKKAFSLIEILIVIGIMFTIGSISLPFFVGYRNKQNLDLTTQEIVGVLRNAQNRSITQENGRAWSVIFVNPSSGDKYFELFSNLPYASQNVFSRSILRSGITFVTPLVGSSSIVTFASMTGYSSPTSISVALSGNPNVSSTININTNGEINIQ